MLRQVSACAVMMLLPDIVWTSQQSLGLALMSTGPLLCTLSSIMYRHLTGRAAADLMYTLSLALKDLSTISR